MLKEVELRLAPSVAHDWPVVKGKAIQKAGLSPSGDIHVQLIKRSIDARGSRPLVQLRLQVSDSPLPPLQVNQFEKIAAVTSDKKVIIIGAGPAGYFAALSLIELGIRPIILDRGKDVQARRRDLKAIQQYGEVNPDSNYCFGEGGAGTYSDGKLYTRSHKRGNIAKTLQILVEHGAPENILIEAHPHIGSNKLPKIVANIREQIISKGGEVHFGKKVTDFIRSKNGAMIGVQVNDGAEKFEASAFILATGHSARDIYMLLHRHNIRMEAKPFALGVRIEHPQTLIDKVQYGQPIREEHLPASSYKLVCQVRERGVFSFCMCPGGLVVPAATAPGEIVVNGMSLSRRDSPYANSGTVVAVELEDLKEYSDEGIFAGLAFQRAVEQRMFAAGDGSQKAPAQRLTDFVNGKDSVTLPASSYIPGLLPSPLHQLLPDFIYQRLQEGIKTFGRKFKGYYTEEANVIGTESRTSSPVRIPRDPASLMHKDAAGLFPCGEGAGFAGGILSAAMDGQNVANKVAEFIKL